MSASSGPRTFLTKALEYVASGFVGFLVAAGLNYFGFYIWPPKTDVQILAGKFGEHCPGHLLRTGINNNNLNIEPESLEHIAICGPGNFGSGNFRDSLVNYLQKRQKVCFKTSFQDNKIYVKPNLESGKIASITRNSDGTKFFFCRCHPEQIRLIMQEQKRVCGLSVEG